MAMQGAVLLPIVLLVIGVNSLPSHHVSGRSSAQLSTLNLQNHDLSLHKPSHHHRGPRDLRFLKLNDPLDCLSQIVCGMNTYPPSKPSVRTSTANDFAFLLRNSIAKLRSENQPKTTTTTTTTVAPATKRTSTTKALVKDSEEDDYEDDDDYEADDVEDYYDHDDRPFPGGKTRQSRRHYSIFSKRRGEVKKTGLGKKELLELSKFENTPIKKPIMKKIQPYKRGPPKTPKPMTSLEKLLKGDLRAKLLSDAQCVNGLQDHTCPFNYQQMLVLISSALERERTVSYTTNKVLPMVGYLIKSRNYTGSLQATFSAIEKINNYTIEADKEGKPIDFTHILDEVMNRETGESGLRIVDTSNDSASASVWEDDEFDHVLQNPYERRRPQSDNYKLDEKKKDELEKKKNEALKKLLRPKLKESPTTSTKKPLVSNDDDATSEEDTSEEGLVFDRRPEDDGVGDSSSEEDDNSEVKDKVVKKKKKKITGTGFGGKKSLVPGPVFGFKHIQKNAEDE